MPISDYDPSVKQNLLRTDTIPVLANELYAHIRQRGPALGMGLADIEAALLCVYAHVAAGCNNAPEPRERRRQVVIARAMALLAEDVIKVYHLSEDELAAEERRLHVLVPGQRESTQ